jgi:hypothetical protein
MVVKFLVLILLSAGVLLFLYNLQDPPTSRALYSVDGDPNLTELDKTTGGTYTKANFMIPDQDSKDREPAKEKRLQSSDGGTEKFGTHRAWGGVKLIDQA